MNWWRTFEFLLTAADPLYLFCTCTTAFCRFSPIEPFESLKSFEKSTIVADRLPPPPPLFLREFANSRLFRARFPYVSPERVHPEAESPAVSTVATDACSASSSTDPCVRLTPESVSAPPLSSRDDYRRCAEECERQVSRFLASRRLSINANAGRSDGPFIGSKTIRLGWCGRGDSNPHGIATASPSRRFV